MNREKIEKTLFILPTCLFLLAISIFPFIYSVYLSAFQAKLTKMHRKFFIGWENYQILLFEDDVFLTAIQNTFTTGALSNTLITAKAEPQHPFEVYVNHLLSLNSCHCFHQLASS